MIDWQGLLKFSLQYSDGTKKSEFKEMATEDKKFLEEAIDHYCNADIHRLQDILVQLNNLNFKEGIDAEGLLQQMQEILDSLDKGGALYKMNGHIPLLRIIFYSKLNSNKIIALQILSSSNQNDAGVQNQSINSGAMELTELIQKQQDTNIKETMMGTISALVRGENLEAKRIYIKIGGLELLNKLFTQNSTKRLQSKIFSLLRDLLYYDDSLHQSYNNLTAFSNTSGLKNEGSLHQDLKYDINAQKMKENEKPENVQFKGAIKKFMEANPDLSNKYQEWIKQEQKFDQ